MENKDYVREAFDIYDGKPIRASREHVKAVVKQFLVLSKQLDSLHSLMRKVLLRAGAKRNQL